MFKIGDWIKTNDDMIGEIIETEVGGMYRIKSHEGNFWHHQSHITPLTKEEQQQDYRYVQIYVDGVPKKEFRIRAKEIISFFVE
jgi:hypothetical protein